MDKMIGRVLIIGVLDQKGSTNISMAYALSQLQFGIMPINYRTIINKYGYVFFTNLVISLVQQERPDLVLICKGNGIMPDLIQEIERYTKVWIYNMDPKVTIDRCPEVRENAMLASFSSCTALDLAQEWGNMGANCFHIFQGVDEGIFRPTKPVKKYKAEVSLIGSRTPFRDEYKEYLEQANIDVKFYGPGYGKSVVETEFTKVCASSKFMLSIDSVPGIHQNYFSNRLLRYLACGACTLHYDHSGSLEQYFKNGEDIIYFKNPSDVVGIINNLTNNTKKTYQIGMNGMDKVLQRYTWQQLLWKMLMTAIPDVIERAYANPVSQNEPKDWTGRPSDN